MLSLAINTPESHLTKTSPYSDSFNRLQTENSQVYESIVLTKMLSKAKFPVILGCLPASHKTFAVKLFPYDGQRINCFFQNEAQHQSLRHNNVISILHSERQRDAAFPDGTVKVSYTIMELAPHGDFCDLLLSRKIQFNDKIARTFFHQLIAGLEYLHSVGVAHLDLKCENLLLGDDYRLKICDFDQAYIKGQKEILSQGTENYRAPELAQRKCLIPEAADIYSVGIILFALKTGGCLPYREKRITKDAELFNLMMHRNSDMFWKKHCELLGKDEVFFDEDFKSLFLSLITVRPERRLRIEQIKKSRWYTGQVYLQSEVEEIFKRSL